MKIDLNKPVRNLDGSPVKKGQGTEQYRTLGNVFSEFIGSKKIAGIHPIKAMNWAFDAYAGKPIEIDKSEMELIKKQIEASPDLPNFVSGQLLECLIDQTKDQK